MTQDRYNIPSVPSFLPLKEDGPVFLDDTIGDQFFDQSQINCSIVADTDAQMLEPKPATPPPPPRRNLRKSVITDENKINTAMSSIRLEKVPPAEKNPKPSVTESTAAKRRSLADMYPLASLAVVNPAKARPVRRSFSIRNAPQEPTVEPRRSLRRSLSITRNRAPAPTGDVKKPEGGIGDGDAKARPVRRSFSIRNAPQEPTVEPRRSERLKTASAAVPKVLSKPGGRVAPAASAPRWKF